MMAFAKRSNQSFVWSFYLRWVIILGVFGLLFPGVDNYAHLGGLISGFLVGWVAASNQVNRGIESLWKVAPAFCCLVSAGALAFAYTRIVLAL